MEELWPTYGMTRYDGWITPKPQFIHPTAWRVWHFQHNLCVWGAYSSNLGGTQIPSSWFFQKTTEMYPLMELMVCWKILINRHTSIIFPTKHRPAADSGTWGFFLAIFSRISRQFSIILSHFASARCWCPWRFPPKTMHTNGFRPQVFEKSLAGHMGFTHGIHLP